MLGRRKRRAGPDDLISASEIACFAYCPEAWRLEYGLGQAPANRDALAAGTRHHTRKAIAERIAGGLIALGQLLAVLVFVALLLYLVFAR